MFRARIVSPQAPRMRRFLTRLSGCCGILATLIVVGCGQSATSPTPVEGNAPASAFNAPATVQPQFASAPIAVAAVARGSAIVQQAERYVKASISERCNCKEFARRVVREASGGRVTLPGTASNNWEWVLPSSGVQLFATIKPSSPRPIYGVDAGDIIQMVSGKSGLHTAIVKSNFGSGMTFVEANYTGCTVTNTRTQSFSAFLNEMTGWTVYRISW